VDGTVSSIGIGTSFRPLVGVHGVVGRRRARQRISLFTYPRSMPNVACPVCGTEYAGWSSRCPSCGTALEAAGELDPTQLTDEEKVIYEMGAWPLAVQAEAAQALAESGVPHTWDDTDLVVHLDFEEQVDALLAEVEREAVAAGLMEPSGEDEGGGEEGDEILYDLADWGEPDRFRLDKRLDAGGIPHVWEGASLVVAASDEALVEHLLDAVEHPDALEVQPDDTDDAADDEVRHELLSDLFDAADRLKRDPGDDRGLAELAAVLAEADPVRPPYGFPALVWRNAVDLAGELGDLLVVAAGGTLEPDDEPDDELDGETDDEPEVAVAVVPAPGAAATGAALVDVEEPVAVAPEDFDPEEAVVRKASALRDLLRPYV
jgi:hypothetical protein